MVVRACGITSSADESNRIVEETCQNELSSALCKLLLQGSTGVGPMEPRVSQKRGVLKNQGSR